MKSYIKTLVTKAKTNSFKLARLDTAAKNTTLVRMAEYILTEKDYILKENKKDVTGALKRKLQKSFIDRLTLNEERLDEMAASLRDIATLPDPVNATIADWQRPNGLLVKKIRVPIGVVLIIYEARPNVTSDCVGLLFKSSNVGILRGGSDAIASNTAIAKVLNRAVRASGFDFEPFFVIQKTSYAVTTGLLKQNEYIDMVIPRGGEALIRMVVAQSRIPVIKHYKGVCHLFIDADADTARALKICVNAKVQRPGVCNAVEKILVHKDCAAIFLPLLKKEFDAHHVIMRGDDASRKIIKGIKKATTHDWRAEYLDLIVTIKVVANVSEAIEHINRYGSHHTDSIITNNPAHEAQFIREVDSACCFANISTRFSDGHQLGLGAEIGISTDKLHARGPMGLQELTTYKWVVTGDGQIRE
ncbi:MAG: glutamate-5-semialdehyde dehydrogenase [Candidatus Omnitrophota bacterium]|nr:glutamate-5-semialdehyde dehydrogenase [Candidatus Omnitrophota bacterium]